MHYTIYRITNKLNGKFYIGKHKTDNLDDEYFGSGKLIRRAIEKYGIENFTKEILFVFDNEQDMNAKEKELVVLGEGSYNLCPGGHGGWGYINATISPEEKYANIMAAKTIFLNKLKSNTEYKEIYSEKIRTVQNNPKTKEKQKLSLKKHYAENGNHWLGKKHTEETKIRIGNTNSIKQSGKNNSQFGTCWITNGNENKKIKIENENEYLLNGWTRGRRCSQNINLKSS